MKRGKTYLSCDDLIRLRSTVKSLDEQLLDLSRDLLAANVAHTQKQFYDNRVLSVAHRLPVHLSRLRDFLYFEEQRHVQGGCERCLAERNKVIDIRNAEAVRLSQPE